MKIPQLIGIAFVVLAAHAIVFAPAMVWAQDDQAAGPAMPVGEVAPAAPDQQVPAAPPPPEVPEAEPVPDQPVAPPPLPPAPVRPQQRPKMAPRPTIRPSERGRHPTLPGVPQPPAAQVEPSTDNLPKNGGTPDQPATFDFNDQPLNTVVESLAKMTGKNFDVDPTIANTRITIITHDQIPPEMAYEVMAAILNARGFALVPTLDGHLVRIVPMADNSAGDKVPLSKGMDSAGKHDEISTHILTVEHADAAELATFIKDLGSRNAVVSAYGKTNTLIMTDTADGLKRMFEFLKEVDVSGFDTQMEIFTLVYSRAEILSSQIMEVLNETGSAPTPQRPGMPPRPSQPTRVPPMRPSVPGQPSSMIVGNKQEVLRIVPDERLNALIVIASNASMDKVRDLVAKLDTPTPYEANNMNVYKLLNADSEKVEKALNAILGTTPRQGGEKGGGGGGGGGAPQGEVQPFEKKVVVTRYESSNALLILASPQDYKVIKELIAQLDVPQRQVLVEAIIMDVSLQDQFGLAVDQAYVKGNDAFGLGNTSNINTLAQLSDAASMATALSSGTAGLALAKQLLSLGNNGGISVGAFQSLEAKIGNKKFKIPFVPFLIKALETLTDVDILSQPTLTTQDNESADIVVGQELPVPTVRSGYSYNPTTTGTTNPINSYPAYGMQSYGGNSGISRQDVGVKMKVKPHINEGDYVSMETEIEVSEATQSDIGINANELGPTFNKSKVTNNVVVRDGSTSVVGGLIKETANHSRKQAPILGDIPVLGFLFRTKNDTRKKQDVVVLLTPHIIKEGSDLDRLSEYKMEEFRTSNVDALFESGLIKKTKKATYMRTKYRPSVERSEKMREPAKFSRGNIERE